MKIHVIKPPACLEYYHGEDCELDRWDLEKLKSTGVHEVWYWYKTGGYEGSGQALLRISETYALHPLGHCSCYGPCDDVHLSIFGTIEDTRSSCSPGTLTEALVLFQAAIG